ncbi:hypothetical protein LC087_18135 [Bacillus carboniphilus]|uniref:Uncharacterized protein n=1 Tax=Bacillus carboniphilus TaxID=86663 RepID=A0ABY9JT62_9BACI|nr:hypothetical protein [Bacillus carboniphilus]WLR42577.1 hypothetical protein LC087_18135 [Bacillus carboniphilus]
MSDQTTKRIMIGILICLIIIILEPNNYNDDHYYPDFLDADVTTDVENDTVIKMGENKIGIIDTNKMSDRYGEIIVLQFNEDTKKFKHIGDYNYADEMYGE